MCINIGNNELSTVKGLMTMTLNSIIADVFDIDLEDIKLDSSLYNDLGMTCEQQNELTEIIADYFDGLKIDFDKVQQLEEIYNIVIETEFEDIPEEAFNL
jgi:hypothetical protein